MKQSEYTMNNNQIHDVYKYHIKTDSNVVKLN